MKKNAQEFFEQKTKRIGQETGTAEKRIFDRSYMSELSEKVGRGEIKKVHITGVCGKATSSLAGLFAEEGYDISGSDVGCYPPASDLINKLNIKFYEGFSKEHVKDKDLTIVANMFGPDNEEGAYVRENNLPQLSMSEAIAEFFIKDKTSIVICGTHGKTTTTGLCAHVFLSAGLNPGFLVGGVAVPTSNGIQETSFSSGAVRQNEQGIKDTTSDLAPQIESKHFIIEGDEYDTAYFDKSPKFLHYKPKVAVVTSLEFDHADIYSDFEEYKKSFIFLAEETASAENGGVLVLNGDSQDVRELSKFTEADVLYYGFDSTNDVTAKDIVVDDKGQVFTLVYKGNELGRLSIRLFGKYNLANTLAVIAIALNQNLSFEQICDGLATFNGMKRRQEIVATVNEITIIDDFAHHPTAVRETLAGIREHFPSNRIFAIFEPRSNTSRKKMFEHEYAHAFVSVDGLVLSMPELRHNDTPSDFIDGNVVVDESIKNYKKVPRNKGENGEENRESKEFYAVCVANGHQVIEKIAAIATPGDVLVIMSNGSFDGIHQKLIAVLEALS
ncbi:MAG: UDP-N-acetylmuramate:L-alanyl-gamma-D-glutamyl-meso-diaminopimelate ligase [Candidatus Pacebacteria bacterium]|nr:UDP-N-acetylmuramate:L-alanyl-gamma-D-glutamyl-meso-diaminopimelate ligase [Candidatus Paceibacterota bacterium]